MEKNIFILLVFLTTYVIVYSIVHALGSHKKDR